MVDTGAFPQTCLLCSLETSTTRACPSAVFQSTCPTRHCWTSTRSCMLTSPPTSLKYATQTNHPDTNKCIFIFSDFDSLSGPPADSENSVSVWGRAPSPLRGTTLRQDSQTIPDQNTLHEFSFSVQGEENVEAQPVFALCLQAELVPATVQDYREKLLHLRKLRHDLVLRSLPQGPHTTFQQVLCYNQPFN